MQPRHPMILEHRFKDALSAVCILHWRWLSKNKCWNPECMTIFCSGSWRCQVSCHFNMSRAQKVAPNDICSPFRALQCVHPFIFVLFQTQPQFSVWYLFLFWRWLIIAHKHLHLGLFPLSDGFCCSPPKVYGWFILFIYVILRHTIHPSTSLAVRIIHVFMSCHMLFRCQSC